MKKEILLILLAISLIGIGCSLSIDIGKQQQLEDQVELQSNYYEDN